MYSSLGLHFIKTSTHLRNMHEMVILFKKNLWQLTVAFQLRFFRQLGFPETGALNRGFEDCYVGPGPRKIAVYSFTNCKKVFSKSNLILNLIKIFSAKILQI